MIKSFDTIASAGYLTFSHHPITQTREITPYLIADFDQDGRVVGLEILSTHEEDLMHLDFSTHTLESLSV